MIKNNLHYLSHVFKDLICNSYTVRLGLPESRHQEVLGADAPNMWKKEGSGMGQESLLITTWKNRGQEKRWEERASNSKVILRTFWSDPRSALAPGWPKRRAALGRRGQDLAHTMLHFCLGAVQEGRGLGWVVWWILKTIS